jgi:hypothetical protein
MAERVPILIGITGKRDLKGEDDAVRERLRRTFETLDREAPNAPKVLLSGVAVGADTIAAELALARPNWLVAAVLPFDAATYFEDFDGPALAALETLLVDPRVKTYTLPPLTNPYTGQPCTREELRNSANATNPLRVMHYEQLGLWLAHAATLLIAVLPKDEQPEQAGGTARVVQYRLSGRPDTVAARVMEGSKVVAPPLPLDIAALGPVWLIDAPSETTSHHPFAAHLIESDRYAVPRGREADRRLQSSLVMPRAFERLAQLGETADLPFTWSTDGADPVGMIAAIHAEIDRIQGRHKRRLVSSSYALAVLFWLAVGAFGVVELARHTKGYLGLWALGVYLTLALAAVTLHRAIDRFHWQRITEDYRGVIEALRMQRAWWQAGLTDPADQVDRHFLSAAPFPFVYVRQAVRNIIHWTRLSAAPQAPLSDWHEVYSRENPRCWLRGQIRYFRDRGEQRKRAVAISHTLGWEALFAAQFLAVWLFLDIGAAKVLHLKIDDFVRGFNNWAVLGIFIPGACLAAAAMIWCLRHVKMRTVPPPRRQAAAFAVVLASLIGPALHLIGIALGIQDADQMALGLGVVVLSAFAAAVRFVAEKLVWEAEAHRYEAALALFQRAAAELNHIGMPSDASRAIVRALGRAALEENEYWLRAHRERPVEQAVG